MPAPLRTVRADLRELATTYCFTAAAAGAYAVFCSVPGGYALAAWLAAPRLALFALRTAGRIAYSDGGEGGVLKVEQGDAALRDASRPAAPPAGDGAPAPFFPESADASGVLFLVYAAAGLAVAAAVPR